jgi:IS5 family transposase
MGIGALTRKKSAAMRRRFRRRAAIEALISHLKQDFRLLRCFLKGFQGDQLNLMLHLLAITGKLRRK